MSTVRESVRELRAMGSECVVRVVANDPEPIIAALIERLADLERIWTRFDASSEVSRLNAADGAVIAVSDDTIAIVDLAIDAWRATDGLFDPTLLDALRAAGYSESFDAFDPGAIRTATTPTAARLPLVGSIVVDHAASTVALPDGAQLDLGGIGKGRAADLLARHALDHGAAGVCVDLGGDVRVGGTAIDGGGWGVVVDDPSRPGHDLAVIALSAGGVATSSRLRRRWTTTDGEAHHLLDPASGRPSDSDLVVVTVVAADTAWAEVHAKAVLVGGSIDGMELLAGSGLSGLLITESGEVLRCGAIDDYLIDTIVDRIELDGVQ